MTRSLPAVQAVSVGDLVRQRTGQSPDPWQLALVQRSVVWDEVRIARLLDSLLAGYPIGALLVCRVRQGGSILVQTEDGREAQPADKTVTQLLDGQQRVNALVCLFSEAGDIGRFFLDMTAPRAADAVVTRRRDKRALIARYIHWTPDGRFSDEPGDHARRGNFLDLSRLAGWAERVGGDGAERARAELLADDSACIAILRGIDPEFATELPVEVLPLAAGRTRRLLDIWQTESIAVQQLVLDEPSDVLQVFTRINLEGVNVAGDDVFFAGVKTRWPAAEQTVHRVVREVPVLQRRLTGLRVLSRLASIQVAQGDMQPLRVDRLNGEKGAKLIAALEDLVATGPQLTRMDALSRLLSDDSGLGHALRLVHDDLWDHVFGWVAINPTADDPAFLRSALHDVATYLVGATAYYYPTVLRDTFSRMAFREALAAGHAGEPFPIERIVAAARRQWPELRVGQRWVMSGPVQVDGNNARLFLDGDIHPWAFEERHVPGELVRADLVLAARVRAPEEVALDGLLSTNEMRAIALEYLREKDPERTHGEHYYDVLHAAEAVAKVSHGDSAPRMHGVLSNAPELFASLGQGRFTWVPRPETGRRYWVMRSDRGNRSVLWAELQQGRLRQGWGWDDDQDLRLMRRVSLSGGASSDSQKAAARNRRMLSDEPNSIQIGDLIVIPHMPAERRVSLARVIGPYEYDSGGTFTDYRHVLPVELLSGRTGIDLNDPRISPRLRSSLGNQNRMWNIDPVGPELEMITARLAHSARPLP